MADLIALRAQIVSQTAALDAATQKLEELQTELDNAGGDLPPQKLIDLRMQVGAQMRLVNKMKAALNALKAEYKAGVAADPMNATDAGLPLVLLPIRIETAYLPGAAGTDLVIRVYPDDIHVDSHETELTNAELAAGTAYWQSVWGAGANADRVNNAWHAILQQLKPNRAAWAVEALMPSVSRPPDETPIGQPQPVPPLPQVPTRAGNFTRAARTTLLPDHWHFIAFRGGGELFNVDGTPIPDALNVSFGPPGTSANSSNLPFDDASRWLVDLDAAIAAGMAVRIPMAGQDLHVDQLFVLGVSSSVRRQTPPAAWNPRWWRTNSPAASIFCCPARPPTTRHPRAQRGKVLRNRLPLGGDRGTRSLCTGQQSECLAGGEGAGHRWFRGSERNPQWANRPTIRCLPPAIAALARLRLQYPFEALHQLGHSRRTAPFQRHLGAACRPARALRCFNSTSRDGFEAAALCRVMRVSNQPYGFLPTSSLADWVAPADDPAATLTNWLRVFRPYWLAAALNVPRVVDGDPSPDATIVNILSRQPVSETIMLRADGDDFAPAQSGAPLPPAPIPGINMSSELFLAAPADAAVPSPVPFVDDPGIDQQMLTALVALISDSIQVVTGVMDQQVWVNKYGGLFGVVNGNNPLADLKPDLFTSMIKDSLTDPLQGNQSPLGAMIFGAMEYPILKDDPNFQQQVAAALPAANAILAQLQQVSKIDSSVYSPALREIMDVFSHRYDAWVTSIAARRLDEMRAAKPAGVVIGAYGWVENLSPRTDLTSEPTPPRALPQYSPCPTRITSTLHPCIRQPPRRCCGQASSRTPIRTRLP